MSYKVFIYPSAVEFYAESSRSILESAIDSGVNIGYSCKNGECGSCKCRLLKGTVSQLKDSNVLTEEERKAGYILSCIAKPESDLEIEANHYPELDGIMQGIYPCKIDSIDFPAKDVAIMKLRLPPSGRFRYLAGQHIDLIYKDIRRSYSIANYQQTSDGLELHIRRVDGGAFSNVVFNVLKPNQLLRFEGPLGTFFYHDENAPIILIAGGTGFAPIKAIVEQLIFEGSERRIIIYWGSQTIEGFYSDLPKIWENEFSNIKFIAVLSGEEKDWRGRRGLVHKAVIEDINDLAGYDVYACGSPEMINAARIDLIAKGLKPNRFYSDAFTASN